MGAGFHGGFGGTKGATTVYEGTSKSSALSSVPSFPKEIQSSVKSFFKGGSNHYNRFSVEKLDNGNYKLKMENPGRVPGSKAVYCKIVDSEGHTVRVYKETYDPNGKLVHTKEK